MISSIAVGQRFILKHRKKRELALERTGRRVAPRPKPIVLLLRPAKAITMAQSADQFEPNAASLAVYHQS